MENLLKILDEELNLYKKILEISNAKTTLLKEVAKDRLVIMVTHNPELAAEYSTRIIRMLDGVVTSDSAPLTEEELVEANPEAEELAPKKAKKKKEKIRILRTES